MRFIQYVALVFVLAFCSSCATVLPESHPERKAIVSAVEHHARTRYANLEYFGVSRVEATSDQATVYYSVSQAGAQRAGVGLKSRLTRHNGDWKIVRTKEDVSLLTRIVLPHGK